jgi:COP9 signalosome complex subunit 2
MGDDDDFMLEEAEDYGFQYESDDGEEADASIENQYYSAKGPCLRARPR